MSATRRLVLGALCAAAAVTLATCAPRPEPWVKPGAQEAELRRDLAACAREATGEGPFHFRAWAGDYETTRARIAARKAMCMRARGWTLAAG
jgi:hypothetical protein